MKNLIGLYPGTIVLAHKTGMLPGSLEDIEIRGLSINVSKRQFIKANINKWTEIKTSFGAKELK